MTEKPEGPIWIDMGQMLADNLTVVQLVHVANLALNRLDLRAIGEICGEVGLTPRLELVERERQSDLTS
jgi:hypothetical protein